jgi:hypothetical protein
VSAEEVAAFDSTRDEGRLYMLVDGKPLEDHARFKGWQERGQDQIQLDLEERQRLGLRERASLAELLEAVKRQPVPT